MAKYKIPVSIFMAANQIRLLELAQKTDFGVFQAVKELRNDDDNNLNIEVVAFTDPNDLLSYEIEKLRNTNITNVIINNTWDFGYFEGLEKGGPFMSAHTGYLENDRVLNFILCGQKEDCNALR